MGEKSVKLKVVIMASEPVTVAQPGVDFPFESGEALGGDPVAEGGYRGTVPCLQDAVRERSTHYIWCLRW